ncbi:mechanosensitive ion channel family protein [Polynucleobacter sphagniphilus]|jgi:small conductance mechanosensitive channel|uniref:Small-conductance mechanosensitive channel n=1 Tax=Polynucleobacter sphagniphilus TaxID=1743169 RepID=A0AA43M8M5_9BURK|nr:mechanosensitive ion channel family protein [Polynucleobacter sphagniphilus]MDF9787441.1 small conductance mechanosensitive channel [Polynucleobacter sphagniphilus]MDH6154184.1 small conductance mechanosensitive channel [Polynucleobacter sphagniphilus]MDH6240458.1 small conductance mechanosensitive channel [Polynucleobacter sphagniphilus]MDH6248241.1 small conductance mechanosensitive channel [Polynucleobacter sphagniphilus]MDH6302155.1 small conductance mechanosensitive channel [Polynucleo
MKEIDLGHIQDVLINAATDVGLKILAAIAIWIIGRWLIGITLRVIKLGLQRQHIDATILRYAHSVVSVTLNILLVIGILGNFGIQTTSFAALIATAGVAIGAAWAGLLSNFAAGIFIIVLRPFKVGDTITAVGITGTVKEIGLFSSTLYTSDNIATIIGNTKILGDNIQNYTNTPYRRVDMKYQISSAADPITAMALLREKVSGIENVLDQPAVEVNILEFNLVGPVLAVRPYCKNENYWQVYFDTNRVMSESLNAAGFPAPVASQHMIVKQSPEA